MIVFPNCKINLGLHIVRKRTDGYHDLETIFYPVAINDILEVLPLRDNSRSSTIPFSMSGLAIEGDASTNLCIKAYRLLKKDFPDLPHITMHLHKIIPYGAGLGGGSADGSFTLVVLNKIFNLGLSEQQLLNYALQLGSDCPFFIINKPCLATGRGDQLKSISLDLSGYDVVLVNPGIHVNTGDAFREMQPREPDYDLEVTITKPVSEWKRCLVNDFEKVVFRKHREIVEIKDELYRIGALYASMSGSGSTVFGIFEKSKVPNLQFPSQYFTRTLPLG